MGMNAGLGNLGVSVMQFLVPLAITAGMFGVLGGEPQTWVNGDKVRDIWLQNAGFIWVPFIVASSLAAWLGMNDVASARASFGEQVVILKHKHMWLMSWLYLGTFGSYIGFSAGLPLLIRFQFPDINPTQYAFLGPLMGAMIRPVGGWMSDKLGGASVTFWNFMVMAAAVSGVLYFLPDGGVGGNFWGFLAMFMLLFLTTGIGNGSTFSMIPVIFMIQHQREAAGKGKAAEDQAIKDANKEGAAVLGFSAAIAAYGAFFIPRMFGSSIALTGGANAALYGFIGFYATCLAITWWYYARKNAPVPC